MKIVEKEPYEKMKNLAPGDVFKHDDSYFIVLAPTPDYPYNSVQLTTGRPIKINQETKVKTLEIASFVVKVD